MPRNKSLNLKKHFFSMLQFSYQLLNDYHLRTNYYFFESEYICKYYPRIIVARIKLEFFKVILRLWANYNTVNEQKN